MSVLIPIRSTLERYGFTLLAPRSTSAMQMSSPNLHGILDGWKTAAEAGDLRA